MAFEKVRRFLTSASVTRSKSPPRLEWDTLAVYDHLEDHLGSSGQGRVDRTSSVGLICNLHDSLDGVFRCDLCFDCDGLEVGCDSVYVEESSSVPYSRYTCF